MKFRTEIDIPPFSEQIDYSSKILTIGSCFAERIGRQMERAKLSVMVNPTGTLFNPISICRALERFGECRHVAECEISQGKGSEPAWHHKEFHSMLSRATLSETTEAINSAIESAHTALEEADWVVITLGTAWIYEEISSGEVVASCHKRPAREFSRRRMSVEEVVEALSHAACGALRGKRIILTVSPIRHAGDGLVENSLSKSILRVAAAEMEQRFEQVHYFPSYEIMMDDLRDYRFYEQDMVHVAPAAVEYIWEQFLSAALSSSARSLLPRVMQVVRGAEHRPTDISSDGHQRFVASQLSNIEKLEREGVSLRSERERFESQLKK